MAWEQDDKVYRNLQEQVGYLTEELTKIKQAMGSALPDPIEGPQGPQGPQGNQGPQGEKGNGIIGYGTQLPLSAKVGDYFIKKEIVNDIVDYVMYKYTEAKVWRPQFSLKGPQGLKGEDGGTEVLPNPEDEAQDDLITIEIDGVVYSIAPDKVDKVNTASVVYATDNLGAAKTVGYSTLPYGDNLVQRTNTGQIAGITPTASGHVATKGYVDDATKLEALVDADNHNRFIGGDIAIRPRTGQTISYAKWSLSGTHLMIVVAGEVDSEHTGSISYSAFTLPNFIANKISPIYSDNVCYSDIYGVNKQTGTILKYECILTKSGSSIGFYHSTDIQANNAFRIQIDLLVDND